MRKRSLELLRGLEGSGGSGAVVGGVGEGSIGGGEILISGGSLRFLAPRK